ncbi:MAG: biopolymer transporter ExbD [Candidatus Omnitrophota bacterium]
MINIKGSKDYIVALESVAMTDIVMTMFIFFFISFSLLYTFSPQRVSKIEVNLPSASSAVALKGENNVILAVTKEGTLHLGKDALSAPELKKRLKALAAANPRIRVVLKVDRLAAFDGVMKALDIINELKIERVSVAAIKGPGEAK